MEFEILGPLRVRLDDGAREVPVQAQHGLLAVLLTSSNAPISDDRLIDELWGDDPPPSARHLLQVYASQLRGLLGELPDGPRVVRDGAGYTLRVGPDELDAGRFEAAVARARELQELDPEAADRALSDALALWHGEPFAGSRHSSPAVRTHAAHLERMHLEALQTWFDIRLRLGHHREVVPQLMTLAAQHPYDEAVHVQLTLALYRCGRQAEALATARSLESRLREDLAIEPTAGVRDLYRRILLQDPELGLEPPEPPSNLPRRLTSFIGRRRELQEATRLVEGSRLVTLTGPGGVGKTRLALEAAEQLRPRFPGGVWWIDLALVTDPGAIADELARVLGVAVAPAADAVAAVARALSRRRALLLIDNCEHLSTAVGRLVATLLEETTAPRVLATSRTPLHVQGEQLWTVPPLTVPDASASISGLSEADAVRLFVDRARAVEPSFGLDGDNAAAVVEVCERLDGLSLAIEMAAARLPILTPQETLQHLDERFAVLALPAVDTPARHATLEAAFDASHALLSEQERRTFERLSVFAGPFELDAATAVGLGEGRSSSGAVPVIASLVEASLVTAEREGEKTSYRLLETLREYGVLKLREHGGEDDARAAHADYHLDLAARAAATLGTPEFASWVVTLNRSYGDVRQALAWSLQHRPRATTLRAAPALREFWYRRADAREAARWTAAMLDGDLAAAPPHLLAETHNAAAFTANVTNEDLQGGLAHANEAVRLSREARYVPGLVFALWARSNILFALGDMEAMQTAAREALTVCDEQHDRWGRAGPLSNLGFASLFGGAPADARARFEEALPLYRELGDIGSCVLLALAPLSEAALRQTDLQAAEGYATEAVELAAGTGWQACALVRYAAVLIAEEELEAAEATTLRALHVALDAGLEIWFRIALRDLARIAADKRRFGDAATLLAASRRNMAAWGLDPAVYGPVEQRCRAALGDTEFDRLAIRGEAMNHDELTDLAHAGTDRGPPLHGDVVNGKTERVRTQPGTEVHARSMSSSRLPGSG